MCVGGTSAALSFHWMKPFTAETSDRENLGEETLDLGTLGQDSEFGLWVWFPQSLPVAAPPPTSV